MRASATQLQDFQSREHAVVAVYPLPSVSVSPIPEPGTWALFAAGLAVMASIRLRRGR